MVEGVQVEGLAQALNALGRMDKRLRAELRGELRELAGHVAETARRIAEQKGLRRSGDLIAGVHPGARSAYAYVSDTAKHRGFNYPRRIEFEHNGQRSFLRAAAKAEQPAVFHGVEALLDRLISNEGLQKGGLL